MGFFDDEKPEKKEKKKPRKKATPERLYSLNEIKSLFEVFKDAVKDGKSK